MQREQEDKPSFLLKIFDEGGQVFGRPRFLRFFQSSLVSPIFSSIFFEEKFSFTL